MSQNLQVCVRIRPSCKNEENCVLFSTNEDEKTVTFSPKSNGYLSTVNCVSSCFSFDQVFNEAKSQEEVFQKTVLGLIDGCFSGLNATCMAYGQTGSGKTYTLGFALSDNSINSVNIINNINSNNFDLVDENTGILPRVISSVFEKMQEMKENNRVFSVKVAFLEIYNDVLVDLLAENSENLGASGKPSVIHVRDDSAGNLCIMGLNEVEVSSRDDMLQLLMKGSNVRVTAATQMNATSSRSHAIFSILFQEKVPEGEIGVVSKFHFVDLAGSERVKKTGAVGQRFKEGVNINKGLLSLGNVISALADNKPFIPYRDSKLTRFLQDSLGGNSRTVMIACVSPADSNLEETLNTIKYADRAKRIKNKPTVNHVFAQSKELMQAIETIDLLRKEIEILKSKSSSSATTTTTSNRDTDDEIKYLLQQNAALESEVKDLNGQLEVSMSKESDLKDEITKIVVEKDKLQIRIEFLQDKLVDNKISVEMNEEEETEASDKLSLVRNYISKIAALEDKLSSLQQQQQQQQQRQPQRSVNTNASNHTDISNVNATGSDSLLSMAGDIGNVDNEEDIELNDGGEDGVGEQENAVIEAEFNSKQKLISNQISELSQCITEKEKLYNKMIVSNTASSGNNNSNHSNNGSNSNSNSNSDAETVAKYQREKIQLQRNFETMKNLSDIEKQNLQKRIKSLQEKINTLLATQAQQRKLAEEIQKLKANKVSLMKKMREETEKFREWRTERENQIKQLQKKSRMDQIQLQKMEAKNQKTQNILQRKIEEANLASKRLNDYLTVRSNQTSSSSSRNSSGSNNGHSTRNNNNNNNSGNNNNNEIFIKSELEKCLQSEGIRKRVDDILESRRLKMTELAALQGDVNDTQAQATNANAEKLRSDIDLLTEELSICQTQLLQWSTTATPEWLGRWLHLRTVTEHRNMLGSLFNMYFNEVAFSGSSNLNLNGNSNTGTGSGNNGNLNEVFSKFAEAKIVENALRKEMKLLESKMRDMTKKHEDKVIFLLKQQQQQQEEEQEQEKNRGKKKKSTTTTTTSNSKQQQEVPVVTTVSKAKSTSSSMAKMKLAFENNENDVITEDDDDFDDEDDDDDGDDDDHTSDEDWTEESERRRGRSTKASSNNNNKKKTLPVSSGTEGNHNSSTTTCRCKCKKGKCSTKMCPCRKHGKFCDSSCKCQLELCVNIQNENAAINNKNTVSDLKVEDIDNHDNINSNLNIINNSSNLNVEDDIQDYSNLKDPRRDSCFTSKDNNLNHHSHSASNQVPVSDSDILESPMAMAASWPTATPMKNDDEINNSNNNSQSASGYLGSYANKLSHLSYTAKRAALQLLKSPQKSNVESSLSSSSSSSSSSSHSYSQSHSTPMNLLTKKQPLLPVTNSPLDFQ